MPVESSPRHHILFQLRWVFWLQVNHLHY
jgi:hypothetical protein